MKRIYSNALTLSILVLLLLSSNSILAQSENFFPEFRIHEEKVWQEKIAASKGISSRAYFDVLFYDLNVKIDIHSPYISGSVGCRFRAADQTVEYIVLDLHNALQVDSIKGNVSDYEILGDSIKISLLQTLSSNQISEVEIFYQGIPELAGGYKGLVYDTHNGNQPIIATLSTPFLAHYWWPCKDGPGDKADSVYIDITIPDTTINGIPLIAVSNGNLENVITENGYKTFQWRERYPIVTYYVMAAISNYKTFQQIYTTENDVSFPIDYYVFNDHLSDAQVGVEKIPETMELFSNYFGEYPFKNEKYGMTQLGFYSAIENQTNTITNNMSQAWLDVSVHELAHMWFGDMITCKSWHHGWLNEGFATYSEALWAESQGGEEAYKSTVASFEYFNPGTLYLEDDTDPFNIFISIIYNKGAYVLHMLRGILGDELFFESLKQYATNPNLKYGYAETEDFKNICEEVSSMELDYFFEQWIYDEGYPRYNYGWGVEEVNGSYEVELIIEQVQTMGPIFKMPVELGIEYVDGTEENIVIWDSTQSQRFNFSLQSEPQKIKLDPDNWILKKVNQIFVDPPFNKGVLLVNGLNWSDDIYDTYEQKSYWGDYEISFWDLRDTPNSGYPQTLPTPLGNGDIDVSTLQNYSTLIWVSGGNDSEMFNKYIIKSYLDAGGNILLLTSAGRNFLDEELTNYLGIEWSTAALATLQDFKSVYPGLSDITLTSNQVFINTFQTSLTSSSSTLLYQSVEGFDSSKGVGVIAEHDGKGKFALLSCKPYLFDSKDLSQNIGFILQNFMEEPVSSVASDEELINDFIVKSIYPNPFNPSTTLEFHLPELGLISIEVYNILGERVDMLTNSEFEHGWNKYQWKPENLSSGVYLIRFNFGQLNYVKKAVFLK